MCSAVYYDKEIDIMKQKFLAMFAAAVLLMGMTGCTTVDNPSTPVTSDLEQSLVGLWWEEFEYADVTENDKPFNRALIVVEANADHTGYVALAVFDNEFNEPLEIYGGPKDAPFTWQVTPEGRIILTDPNTGTSMMPSRTRGKGCHLQQCIT